MQTKKIRKPTRRHRTRPRRHRRVRRPRPRKDQLALASQAEQQLARVFSSSTVDRLRVYCRENRISCLYEDRYPFANGGSDYYALFVEDPDRIKVEFVAAPTAG